MPTTMLVLQAILLMHRAAYGATATAKTFTIAGAVPMQAIVLAPLEALNTKRTRFGGPAVLQVDGGTPVGLSARLRVTKNGTGSYTFRSTAKGFPKFRGVIRSAGDPERPTQVALTLKIAKGHKVSQSNPASVSLTADAATTTTTTSTTTTTLVASGRFDDRGDGTITDTTTGLMWEKKGNEQGLHQYQDVYTWAGLCAGSGTIAYCQPNAAAAALCSAQTGGAGGCAVCDGNGPCELNTSEAITTIWDWLVQVNAEGGVGLAGHSDWRIPTLTDGPGGELSTIVKKDELFPPETYSAFKEPCLTGCSALTCSCTLGASQWSSSSSDIPGSLDQDVSVIDFAFGRPELVFKDAWAGVRAVRAGRP